MLEDSRGCCYDVFALMLTLLLNMSRLSNINKVRIGNTIRSRIGDYRNFKVLLLLFVGGLAFEGNLYFENGVIGISNRTSDGFVTVILRHLNIQGRW